MPLSLYASQYIDYLPLSVVVIF